MQKRHCTQRAEWRLLRGQSAKRLSAHYQLDCDYGTRLITIYKDGDPVFLCASHATAIGRLQDNCIADVRLIETPSFEGKNTPENDQRAKPTESAAAKQNADVPVGPMGSVAGARAGLERAPSPKRPVSDLTYGNSAKALVDETIWNMPTGDYEMYRSGLEQGKSATEAAQSAGGQLAIVHRKIDEYTLKLEAVLSESKATINVSDVIGRPFEQAVLEIISDAALSEPEKDSAIDHLGRFQEQINRGLDREIIPLQAHRIARAIGDRANWGIEASLSEELKPALRTVYTSVRNAIRAAVPEVNDLDERLANLRAAKSDLEKVLAARMLHSRDVPELPAPVSVK